MKLILHIGTGKTGSTTVQEFLGSHKADLLKQKVYYPETHGSKNHVRLHAIAKPDTQNLRFMRTRGIRTPKQQQAAKARWKQAFTTEIKACNGMDVCVISSEHLCGLEDKDIRGLKALLQPLFSEIDILVYIRDPIEYAVSMYDTALKTGSLNTEPSPARLGSPTDYRHLIQVWGKHFGTEAITVRIFDRSKLIGNDIITDFAATTGIDINGWEMPSTANPSINRLGQNILLEVNKRLPPFHKNGKANPRRLDIHRVFERHFNQSPKYTPTKELVASYREVFAESNEWVRNTYFPEQDTLFKPRNYPDEQAAEISSDQAKQIASLVAELWEPSKGKK